jgi:cell division protein FtsN
MPKDFAKKKTTKKRRGASRQSGDHSSSKGLWFFTLFLATALVSGLVYLKWDKPENKQSAQQSAKQQNNSKTSQQKSAKPTNTSAKETSIEDDVPIYDLHDDLINKEVKIPQEDLKLPKNLNNFYYSMRCGSFRESFRAEELKAQIAMTGNNSTIMPVLSKGETWHRVELGPFNRKRAAESIRHRLQDNNIQGCIINRHIKKN